MTIKWQAYNPDWLVKLAKMQMPAAAWLAEALAQCTSHIQSSHAYIHFVDPTEANGPGSQWQFLCNISLYDQQEGQIIIDVLEGNKIGGIEFLKRL